MLPGEADAASRRPVFGWERFGGFVAPGTDPLAAPRLVVYGDGLAVADASRSLGLNPRVTAEIRIRAVAVLANPDNLRRRTGVPVIVDAPQTRFTATASRRRYTGVVDALAEYRSYRAYPKPLYDLLDDATALRERILISGRPFRPAAVRLVVIRLDAPPPGAQGRPWPAGVAVPPLDADSRTGQANLYGRAARRVVAGIGSAPPSATWQTFRTERGTVVQAAWRYLLPHE